MPNITYLEEYVKDGQAAPITLSKIYDTILVGDADNNQSFYRIPWDDFFIKYQHELEPCVQFYAIPEIKYYKPKMVSMELYGTTELWLSLLRLNYMRNISEFNLPMIKVYNPVMLQEYIDIFFKRESKR